MRQLILCISLFLTLYVNGWSQDFVVPANYKLVEKADYTSYEKDVIEAAKWLVNTPIREQEEKRKEVSRFIFEWVNGSPTVSVEINPSIMDIEKKNPGMFFIYMSASARYVLETGDSKDMRAKHRYALREMVKFYSSNEGMKKDKKMESLVKAEKEGTIDEWIASNLKINEK